ncbi:MAG: hypothetical protein H6841_00090 [Planctomycetes bacterium]|nr:hypothetical protein [Planctomycetota bacterium]
MKGPQLSALIWLANLLVLAGGAFAGYKIWAEIRADRDAVYHKASTPTTKEKRLTWLDTADPAATAEHKYYQDTMLSPRKRPDVMSISPTGATLEKETSLTASGGAGNPTSYNWTVQGTTPAGASLSAKSGKSTTLKFTKATPQGSTVTVRASLPDGTEYAEQTYTLNFSEKADPVPTDAELAAELEKWVNSQFVLLRLWYGPEDIAKAVVISNEAGKATLLFRAGLVFKEEYKPDNALDPKVQKLAAHDLTVVKIEWDHVLMKGPSRNPKYKDRYYEVKLKPDPKAFQTPDASKLGKTGKIPDNKVKLPDKPVPDPRIEPEDPRPRQSTYDADTDTWTLGTDDYKNIDVDELAKYAKVVHDREGKPLGIQISEDIPDDNTVIARGGRKGDIIKAINGEPVASMSDVRRIVRTQYNAGTEEFVVTFERDGVPGTKIFKAPKKK